MLYTKQSIKYLIFIRIYRNKRIFAYLYFGKIDEAEKGYDDYCIEDEEEMKLYNALKEKLNKEQFDLFNEFIELYTLHLDKFTQCNYARVFKTGLLIGMECANFKL